MDNLTYATESIITGESVARVTGANIRTISVCALMFTETDVRTTFIDFWKKKVESSKNS